MATVFLIFLCVSAAMANCDIKSDAPSDRASDFVGSFNRNLDFLNKFFSANNIDNYKFSRENVPATSLTKLNRIANTYSTLRGEFVTWCTYVDNVIIDETYRANTDVTNLPEYDPTRGPTLFAQMTSKSSTILSEMRQRLQSLSGQTRYRRGSNDGYGNYVLQEAFDNGTFKDDVATALRIINQLLGMIDNNLMYELLNEPQMKCKCKPILNFTAQSLQSRPTPPTQSIRTFRPSQDDLLERHIESCGSGLKNGQPSPPVKSCHAYFMKDTLNLLNKFYQNEDDVARFLNQINSSRLLSECRRYFTEFIKDQYISWGYEAREMSNTQLLHISVRLDGQKLFKVEVAN